MRGVHALSHDDRIDLSIAVVNYNAVGLIADLIPTLLAQRFTLEGRPARIEILLVDNASRREDHERLESLRGDNVRLIRNTENIGYALANEQAFRVARGRYHLVSNPDVRVEPHCFERLFAALLAAEDEAVVGPLASIDGDSQVFLPMMELPSPWLESLIAVSRMDDRVSRWHSRRRSRLAHRYWTAKEPMEVSMLSGGFFLARRETFLCHGLFDPGYPLYFEDTDLFRRLRSRGVKLLHVPDARIVHLFSRSALPRMNAAMVRNRYGQQRYTRTWFGEAGTRLMAHYAKETAARARDGECAYPLEDMEVSGEPPILDVADVPGAYIEFAGNARFSLTAGIFPAGPGPFRVPPSFWADLPCVRYWARTVDPANGETLKAWRIHKCPSK